MKQFLTFIFIVTAINFSFGQEAYFSIGRNFTTYDYINSEGESNINIEGSSGNAYELGYVFYLGKKIDFAAGLTLNEFNATGGTMASNYSWNTNYLGFQGVVMFSLVDVGRSNFGLDISLGANLNHIVNGQQKINGQTYDLTNEVEFSGIFIQPLIGLDASYYILKNLAIGIGYRYSKNIGFTNSSPQKLDFDNSQLQFKIIMTHN